jgi:hypothetical protein
LPIKTALTAEEAAALDRYRARWLAIRRASRPADRTAAEEGVRLAYQIAGLAAPARFVWCDSPVALSRQASSAARADGPNVRSAVIDSVRRHVTRRVRSRLNRRVWAKIEGAINPADPLITTVSEIIVQNAAHHAASLWERLDQSRPLSLPRMLGALLAPQSFRDSSAGPHELSWLGPFEYVRSVLGFQDETAPLLGLWLLATNAFWVQPHERSCWLAERPTSLRSDAQGRLHDPRGPALRFADGWTAFAWKGVEIPRWMIEQPQMISLGRIDAEFNVQLRRCMIEIMTPQRFVALGGARKIAEDEAGVLWRKIWLNYDVWTAVEVINGTPEPDGSHKHYFLQVPANVQTAREAVAWTYGLPADAYAKLMART